MAQSFPYTYYACSCYDSLPPLPTSLFQKRASQSVAEPTSTIPDDDEADDNTFNPHSPRANYSLFPIEHLLYCADCREMRCPRCVTEEVLSWMCPSCQTDAGSPATRENWNRCTRNCLNCPVCTSNLMVSSLKASVPAYVQQQEQERGVEEKGGLGGPCMLDCPYCHWTSLDIGIELDRPSPVVKLLQETRNGGEKIPTLRERDKERSNRIEMLDRRRYPGDYKPEERMKEADGPELKEDDTAAETTLDVDERYANLLAFYKSQMAREKVTHDSGRHSKYISRLLSSTGRLRAADSKPRTMHEARNIDEGLSIINPDTEAATIARMKEVGWAGTLPPCQRMTQINSSIRFTSELRPNATIFRTKRTKRCRTCRQILSRPESKTTSHRYKIKLLALNQIPRISLRALNAYPLPFPGAPLPSGVTQYNYNRLIPMTTTQYLLTLTNPLFDPIKVTLATPGTTPGRIASRVTILCPQFEIGANTDVWEEALGPKRTGPGTGSGSSGGERQAEAGKVWDKGRNWTSVILEIVPGMFTPNPAPQGRISVDMEKAPGAYPKTPLTTTFGETDEEREERRREEAQLEADEDVLDVPLFVRLEYETAKEAALGTDMDGKGGEGKGGKEKREEAFWCVLGAGRIALS